MNQTTSKTPVSERDEARTPEWVWHWNEWRYGPILHDVASRAHNHLSPMPNRSDFDGLRDPWRDQWWCNPPYSRGNLERWAQKAAAEAMLNGVSGSFLCPCYGTNWWDEYIVPYAAEITILGRVKFLRPDGVALVGTGQPQFNIALVRFCPALHKSIVDRPRTLWRSRQACEDEMPDLNALQHYDEHTS